MHTGGTEREHLSGRDWSLQNVSLSYIILLNMDQKKLREKKKEEEEWSWQRNTDTPIDRGVSSLFPPPLHFRNDDYGVLVCMSSPYFPFFSF